VLGVKWSLAPGDFRVRKLGPIVAVEFGLQETLSIVDGTLTYLGRWIAGHESLSEIGGPVGIALASGKAARLGFDVLLRWAAAISTSVGLLNLFPIPLLDGGHLLFC
jgi:regulator of sigma E protease